MPQKASSRSRRKPSARAPAAPAEKPRRAESQLPFCVVGIGASAGGIEAVTQLLRALDADTGLAFVLVQHLDPTHPSMLTEILARATKMRVMEVSAERTPVLANHFYVIQPGADLVIADGELQSSHRAETRGQHRAIDLFLQSLAQDQGHKAIGIILSGSATDGTLGLEEIKAADGITFAQDDSAQHPSMPRSAVGAGCVDFVLPPDAIARELKRIARHPYVAPELEPARLAPEASIDAVLELLQGSHGVDFSHYKRNTLHRRVTRRMVLSKIEKVEAYLKLLRESPAETEALFQDILINVTSFFRNPEAYDALKTEAFPRLFEGRSRHDPLRLWVLGCSTGEEAYSLAIVLSEYMEEAGRQLPMQIFATDLNGTVIERARHGSYAKTIMQDVSPERLRRFFIESDGGFRVRKSIRDVCVFARHNVLTEPPFSRIDLVSCRNLLIYLGQEMQQRVIPVLHYALQPGGLLWLGNSETIGTYRDLFELDAPKHKIYHKKPQSVRYNLGTVVRALRRDARADVKPGVTVHEPPPATPELQKEADRILLARYAPASVMVNADYEILQFRGDTGKYLAPAPGRASLNLLKMLREGLLVAVRASLHLAGKDEAPVRKERLKVRSNGGFEDVNVEVIPVRGGTDSTSFLVLFEPSDGRPATGRGRQGQQRVDTRTERDRADRESARLTQELAATREYLQSVIEQQEAANEELQSANEEVQSANEELQSINEELETSKEEVQSSNEELATVNDELNHRNAELSLTNNDLLNLLASVQMAIVIVGADLRIRRFTPTAERMLNLIPADVGRPIKDLNLNLSLRDFGQQLAEVIDSVSATDHEVVDKNGRWQLLRLRPYRTVDNQIDGAVIALIDIDPLKRNEETLRRQTKLLEHTDDPIVMWEIGGAITYWNRAAERLYGFSKEQALNRRPHELLTATPSQYEIEASLQKNGRWRGHLTVTRHDGARVVVESRMALVREIDGRDYVVEAVHAVDEEPARGIQEDR